MIPEHVWGGSPAVDRVWSQLNGLTLKMARERLFLVLQAFIDESAEKDGVFVLGGYIASAEAWARFSDIWGRMLPRFGTPRNDGRYHFKMNEMAFRPDGIKKTEPFFRVIEEHVLGWVSVRIDQSELKRALRRIQVSGAIIDDWAVFENPWYIAFRYLMDRFHLERGRMREVFGDEKIDFYFDNGVDKKTVISIWDEYIKARPDDIRGYYGSVPRFEDDMDFLPLQAADFWVWWVRKWHSEGTPEKIATCDFGEFRPLGGRKLLRVAIDVGEDDLVHNLGQVARNQIGPNRVIFDEKTGKRF